LSIKIGYIPIYAKVYPKDFAPWVIQSLGKEGVPKKGAKFIS